MPPYSLHLLQPLDMVAYLLLKYYYVSRILLLECRRIYHINKDTFLPVFRAAFEKIFILENVCAGF
jgi:hypothetical protein